MDPSLNGVRRKVTYHLQGGKPQSAKDSYFFFLTEKKIWTPRALTKDLTHGPWQWKGRVLTTGLSGKSPFLF